MQNAHSLTVYIASSFRNLHAVHLLRDAFLARGYAVPDWSELAPPLPPDMPVESRRAALDADGRGSIFEFCASACGGLADLVVYLGPSGQDAACEVGMAFGSGVPVYGLAGPLEAPGTILNRAVSLWCADVCALLAAVDAFAARRAGWPGE